MASDGPRPAPFQVAFLKRQRRRRVPRARLERVLAGAARALGVGGEMALVLTADAAVRRLNARYRGKDKPTDVLSFPGPCGEGAGLASKGAPSRRLHPVPCPRCQGELGDVVISLDTADRNARARGARLDQELEVLALHGFLHLLGFDHEADDGTMDRLERRLRRQLLGPASSPPAGPRARSVRP